MLEETRRGKPVSASNLNEMKRILERGPGGLIPGGIFAGQRRFTPPARYVTSRFAKVTDNTVRPVTNAKYQCHLVDDDGISIAGTEFYAYHMDGNNYIGYGTLILVVPQGGRWGFL